MFCTQYIRRIAPNQGCNIKDNGRAIRGSSIAVVIAGFLARSPDGNGLRRLLGCSLSCSRSNKSLVIYTAPLIIVSNIKPYIVLVRYGIRNSFLSKISAANRKVFLIHCRGLVEYTNIYSWFITLLYRECLDDKISYMNKMRLDSLMLERCLVESMSKARGIIMAGQVMGNNKMVDKAGTMISVDSEICIEKGQRYVSRGGLKLEAGLAAWNVSVKGLVCADVGISTGGFTDCLLQHGSSRVYGIDVGKGIVHWKLRQDDRVVLMESTNARYLECLPEKPDVIVIDASFISLKLLLSVVRVWLNEERGYILALIKPQFEAERKEVGKGGVVRSGKVHRKVAKDVLKHALNLGLKPLGLIKSPIFGAAGNLEFLTYLSNNENVVGVDPEKLVDIAMDEGND